MNQYKDALKQITNKQARKFTDIVIADYYYNFNNLYKSRTNKVLSDEEYILYSAYEQQNKMKIYAEHIPKCTLISGSEGITDKIIFHGSCLECSSQYNYPIERRCIKCRYFRANWSKEDLSI